MRREKKRVLKKSHTNLHKELGNCLEEMNENPFEKKNAIFCKVFLVKIKRNYFRIQSHLLVVFSQLRL